MTNSSQRIRTLYTLLRGGNEQPEVMNVILRLIAEDREARRTYIHLAHMEVNLSWALESGVGPETRIVRQVQQQVHAKRRFWFWSIASSVITALLMLGLGLIRYYQLAGTDLPIQQAVAVLQLDEDAVVDGGADHQSCFIMQAGRLLTLLHGSARLITEGQSDIVFVAPTQLEMSSAKSLKLRQGECVAHISSRDIGFTVETPTNRFIDLGTKLGISVDPAGNSELHVFSGIVAAEPIFSGDPRARRLVESGGAIACTATGVPKAEIPALPLRLQTGFNRLHGIKQITGAARLLPTPPASLRPGEYVDDQFIQLIPERDSVVLPATLKLQSVTTKTLRRERDLVESTLPAGTSCSSILLHCQTLKNVGLLEATIHFHRPILGLVLTTEGLFETDPLFAIDGVDYPTWQEVSDLPISRGCVSSFKGAVDNNDLIQMKDGGHTLIIRLSAIMPHMDQLRILLEPHP